MKYYYVEQFCEKYRQLMAVIYEKDESGEYHKTSMACNNKSDKCSLVDCKHFQKAPNILQSKDLRDKKMD